MGSEDTLNPIETPVKVLGNVEEKESKTFLIDAGTVVMMMTVEGKGTIPIPLPAVFQQLFGIMNHLDARLVTIEEKLKVNPEGESQIITLN